MATESTEEHEKTNPLNQEQCPPAMQLISNDQFIAPRAIATRVFHVLPWQLYFQDLIFPCPSVDSVAISLFILTTYLCIHPARLFHTVIGDILRHGTG